MPCILLVLGVRNSGGAAAERFAAEPWRPVDVPLSEETATGPKP